MTNVHNGLEQELTSRLVGWTGLGYWPAFFAFSRPPLFCRKLRILVTDISEVWARTHARLAMATDNPSGSTVMMD